MYPLADAGGARLVAALGTAQDVDRERRGQRRQRRTRRRIGRRNEPDHEQHADRRREIASGRNHREQLVAALRGPDAAPLGIEVEQHAENEKEQDDE